jgi:hypothetical protein
MCVQCVANALPYVGLAVGGLKVMAWQAGSTRARSPELANEDGADPLRDELHAQSI